MNQTRTLDDPAFALLSSVLNGDIFAVMRDGGQGRVSGSTLIQAIVDTITAQLIGKFGIDSAITRLIGGTSTDLDAKPTTTLQAGYFLLISIPLSDEHSYQGMLMQFHSTDAVGDDVASLDNPHHCWKRVL